MVDLKPGKMNYTPLKSFSTYAQFAFNHIEPAWMFWGRAHAKEGIAVEKKFDGMRSQIHIKDGKIWIFTEDRKRDVSANFPQSVQEALKEFRGLSLILDSEFVDYYPDGKPRERRDMIKFIVGKQSKTDKKWKIDDAYGQFNVFDILYLNGNQIWKLPWTERQKALKQVLPKDLKHFHRVIPIIVHSKSEFESALKRQRSREGSEGAMMKVITAPYELDGRTTTWAKYKNVLEVHLQVMKKTPKKKSPLMKPGTKVKTYVYDVGYKDRDGSITWAAKSYSTNIEAKVGDILTLVPVKVLRNLDKKTGKLWFSLIFPRVKELSTDRKEPDTFAILDKIAKPGSVHAESLPRETKLRGKGLKRFCEYIQQTPTVKRPKFVLQEHRRGDSVHTDLRWQITEDTLVGITLFTPGNLKQRSKIKDWKKGDKIETTCKPYQPAEWLQVEGKVQPGGIGATKYEDAEFTIIDKGWLEVGAIKPSEGFIELFFHGDRIPSIRNGARWIVRHLKIQGRWTWLMFKPTDQRPYVETHPKEEWPRVYPPKKIYIDKKEVERAETINSDSEDIAVGIEELSLSDDILRIGLVALSEGVWNQLFWPREAILRKRSYLKLKNCPVCLEHDSSRVVGKVNDVGPFDSRSIFAELFINDPDTIDDVLAGRYNSASVRVVREADLVRGIVESILDYKEISLVERPACKVCNFTYVKA